MIGLFSRERRAREAAARWALRHAEDSSDPDGAFARWLARHPSHPQLYAECAELWRDCRLESALLTSGRPRLHRLPLSTALAAVAFSCLLLAGFFTLSYWAVPVEPPLHFKTEPGHTLAARLADGSQIELNGDSEVTIRISGKSRQMTLERGEGFFDVQQDPSRPLSITAGKARITVMGTAFDLQVNEEQSEVDLAVYRGKVEIAGQGREPQRHLAQSGQRLRLAGGQMLRLRDFDPEGGDWRSGWLQTDDISLARLVAQLNRLSKHPIEISAGQLSDIRIAGRLNISEPDQLLEKLAVMHHFRVKPADGKLMLTL